MSADPDVREYGFGEVPAARRQELFNEHTRLAEVGFTEIRRGFFVRESAPEIFDVLHHSTGKHSTYISWGLSLAFVPHEFEEHLRFHRTLKSARSDLRQQDWGGTRACYLHSETPFVRDMQAMWAHAQPRAERFWTTGSSVEGVMALADELLAYPPDRFGFTPEAAFFPGPRFVRAMALARLGREEEARSTLREWSMRWAETDSVPTVGVEAALEHVLSLARP